MPASSTFYRLAADLTVLTHGLFILFVVLGGVLVARWPRLAWFHLPAAVWGALIEFAGWVCPLTPLENMLRVRSGSAGYKGDFIEYYVLPLIYPERLTRDFQVALGVLVVVVNLALYWRAFRRGLRPGHDRRPPS